MFRIRLNQAMYVAENLERQISMLGREIEEAYRVQRGLRGMSGMDDIQYTLYKQINCMEESRNSLIKMVKCLDRVTAIYDSCEKRISDHVQQESVHYRRYQIGTNDLEQLSSMLKSFI